MMERLISDVRTAVRVLARSPGFTIVAALTLAVGIGLNTAIFSVLNAVLLRPLPTPELERLVVIRESLPELNLLDAPLAPAEVLDLDVRRDAFTAVTGFSARDRTLTGFGEPRRVSVAGTLGDFASVFGVAPLLGRLHRPEESNDGDHLVAVASYGLWQQLSGGDPSFVGRSIDLNGIAYEVIGVLPRDFRYPREAQLWVPYRMTEQVRANRGMLGMTTIGRMAPGITQNRLAEHLVAEQTRWNEEYHAGSQFGKVLSATGFIEYSAGPLRLILMVLMGAVVFVLLIAAANVGSLQLVRSAGRAREVAVRAALGAGRGRLVRQLLAESLVLGLIGGALGLWLGSMMLDLFARWAPAQQMHLDSVQLDPRVLAFTAAVSLLAVVVFGTLPALRATKVDPQTVLRESSRGASHGIARQRLLQGSVAVQVALALVLLLGSALMLRTLGALLGADPGFDGRNLTTAQVQIPVGTYESLDSRLGFFESLLEQVRAQPGVEDAALIWGLPFSGQTDSSPFDIPSRPTVPGAPERHHEARTVSGGFFRTMRIPLVRGQDFDGTEGMNTPGVVIIDETFAEQFFPGEDPVGQQIVGYTGELATIIGVARNIDHRAVGDAPKATGYYSIRQQAWSNWRSIAVRSAQPPAATVAMLRATVARMDPNVPLYDVRTMDDRIREWMGPRRLAMLALGAFAVVALVLSALGVYGVMRYSTEQRTREIGIRVAVGAEPLRVLAMVLRQGAAIVFIGLLGGGIAAYWLTQFMAGMLFGVSPRDPVAFIAAGGVLAAVALLSTWVPARRATRVDPVTALRAE
jgi:putative ABC transport system permease protein